MLDLPSNPYPGLRPFRTDEEYLFFGRDEQCQDLLRLLSKRRFIGVLGISGTGKSSLVRAGLLPALYRGGLVKAGSHWNVAICRPGGAPVRNLAQALRNCEMWDHVEADDRVPERLEIETVLQRSGMGLREVAQMADMPKEENLLVVVDQFEELFRFHQRSATAKQRDKAEAFVNLLLEGARDENYAIHVVLTMRSGFFGECAAIEGLSEVINRGAYLVPRLTRDQLKEAIEGPVRVHGAEMAARLTQRVLNDAGSSPDELPVLQHALMRTFDLWRERDTPHKPIDLYHYEDTGGMQEALSRHADEVYLSLSESDQRIAQRLFKALTEKDPNNRGIRRPMPLDKLTGIVASPEEDISRVIEAFRAPGVSFLMPSAENALRPDSIIDISHESLMRVWKRLGTWVEAEMQSARIYQRLTETAALWEDMQADLYHDPDLHIARAWHQETNPNTLWAEQYGGGFSRAMRFLNESHRQKEESERAAEQNRERELAGARALANERSRSARRSRRFALVLAVFSVLLACLAAAAYFAMHFARDQAHIAQNAQRESEDARRKVSLTFSKSDYQFGQTAAEAGRYGEALAYLARALKNERGLTAAGDRIHAILTEVSLPVTHFHHKDSRDVEVIAFTPDSKNLITGSYDSHVRVWEIDSNRERTQWRHNDRIKAVAVSHDGTMIATGSRDGHLLVIDKESSRTLHDFRLSADVNSINFSSSDAMLAAGGDDHSVRLYDLANGRQLRLWNHEGAVNQVVITEDQRLIVSVSDDNSARIWEIASGRELLRVKHDDDITQVDIHPQQPLIVTSSEDDSAKVWSMETGECLATFLHDDNVREALFSPDGNTVGTGSDDKTVRIWALPSMAELHHWTHRDSVDDIDFSPDGNLLASASDDQTVRIWETESGWESPISPLVHRLDVDQAKFSPDGNWLGTVADNEVRVWRFEDFRNPPLVFDLENVTVGQLSPTGQWAAAASSDGVIRQWAVADGSERHPEIIQNSEISALVYSPSGDWLISGNLNGVVQAWDARSGKAVSPPLTHANPISAILTPREELLVVAHHDALETRRLPDGASLAEVGLTSAVTSSGSSPTGEMIALGSAGGSVYVRNSIDLTERHTFSHGGSVDSLAFYSDEMMATASSDWSARLWNLRTGKQILRSMGHGGEVTSLQFDTTGKLLLTGSQDQRARIWSTSTASVQGRAVTHKTGVLAVAFSPEGHRFVTASGDLTARVWDVNSILPLTQPLVHEAVVTQLSFTPDRRRLFTVAPTDAARLWNVSLGADGQLAPDIFLEVAQAIGGMQLTGNNQLIPLNPTQRRTTLGRAAMEIQRTPPMNDDAYMRFIRKFIEKHGADLRPRRRSFPGRRGGRGEGRPGQAPGGGNGPREGGPPEARGPADGEEGPPIPFPPGPPEVDPFPDLGADDR